MPGDPSSSGARVLVVNSYDAGGMYCEFLRFHGFDVALTRTPDEALVDLAARPAAVIVTDVVFRGGTVTIDEFIRSVRAADSLASTAILVVSGYVRRDDAERVRLCGADRFLLKPLLPESLLAEVQDALTCFRRGARPPWRAYVAPADRRRQERRRGDRRKS